MENARSLASRFSGLLLFLLSLAVVGVLVYLTIQSASNNTSGDSADTQSQTNTTNQSNLESGAQSSTTSSASDSSGSTPSTGGDASSEVAADTDGEPLPNTGPESAVAGAVALGGLAYAANAYLGSRRELARLKQR